MDDYVEKHENNSYPATIKNRFKNDVEQSISKRIGTNDVDLRYIKSESYRHKFSKITNNSRVNDSLRAYATAMLTHRNGTDGEDLYIIDADTGELLFKKNSGKNILTVELSENEVNEILKLRRNIIGIHNHPTNILPTGGDFVSSGYRKYQFGIVATHDGRLFKYNVGKIPFVSSKIDSRIDKYMQQPYNLSVEDAQIKALKEVRKEYGIEWKEIK